jgi:hypothetical protein
MKQTGPEGVDYHGWPKTLKKDVHFWVTVLVRGFLRFLWEAQF